MTEYLVRYYPETKITYELYPWSWHEVPNAHLPQGERQILERDHGITTIRTGNMDGFRFERLKQDIAERGILNPFIIEYYKKDLPNGAGFRARPCLAIRTGNNRAEAMAQLGLETAPALFVVPSRLVGQLPHGPFTDIQQDSGMLGAIRGLWGEVEVAPCEGVEDGVLGIADAWTDSNLLLELVRATLKDPTKLVKVRQRR